ncbi:tRNA lysidine(34) synthetase TilS [Aureimonas sp. SK2]|uniref:tRNA lysidine(34) synthetase TilS n=1 Tax=Aureimonas sp. SK2 TaxID=3015992 RepID=UPI0024443934|nr:tRNA lysidine(34) synthetase TilS [Aureimonas sp. SK2]
MTSETAEAIRIALGRFASARAPLRRILLAVSGGPDSLALLLACADRALPAEVAVATVDHGLRPGSAAEAAFVAGLCRDLGLPHRTLVWREAACARGNLMEAARDARYALLACEAARVGADAILAAHHADDQLETHLLARARGAVGAGLAGMRPWRDLEPGLALLRPFLSLPKRVLEEAVARAGLDPVRDPTNADERYRRARVRRELADGLHDTLALAGSIASAGRLREAEDAKLGERIDRAAWDGRLHSDDAGVVTFRPEGDDGILWARLLTAAGGAARPPDRSAVARLIARFSTEGASAATLNGCRIERGEGTFRLTREFGRTGPPSLELGAADARCFDHRFDLTGSPPPGAARVVALGRLGLGGDVQRTLPVCVDAAGDPVATHPALGERFASLPALALRQRVGWRIAIDLPGFPGTRLTAEPQIAANPLKPVGKDLAATYLRCRV